MNTIIFDFMMSDDYNFGSEFLFHFLSKSFLFFVFRQEM